MDGAGPTELELRFAAELRLFLAAPLRPSGVVRARHDGTSSLGHVIEAHGVPLPEVGALHADGSPVVPSYRPRPGDTLRVDAVCRPQPPPVRPLALLLDVHLGALARRLRLIGLDTAYRNDLDDAALLSRANAQRRVLLTQDRRLLMRRSLWAGAYVRGPRPDDQLHDVLNRFAPPLAPWSRCTACNGSLTPVAKAEVAPLLRPGTRRTYDTFSRCRSCGRVYWRGAHGARLEALVAEALRAAPPPHP